MNSDAETFRGPEEDEEEDEEVGEVAYRTANDAVLFAIDVSRSMLKSPAQSDSKKPDTALSPTLAALKCAYALMQQRIISTPSDMMGVLLFGTKKSKFEDGDPTTGRAGLQYPHCYLLTDLDVPAAADVKELRNMVQNFDEYDDLLTPSPDGVNMADLLFCANQIFTTKAPNFVSRRLFLVTDNDFPHRSDKDARNSAAVRAKDLYDLGVTIELFPISHPDRGFTFDRSKFYDDIVYSSTPSDPDAPAPLLADIKPASSSVKDGISLLQSLLTSVASRSAPRRALTSNLPFEIGPSLKIGVKAFILFKKQVPKRTSYIYLPPDSEKPQIVSHSSTLLAEDTARSVEKVEVRKAYKFGGETVSFSQEEMAEINNYGDPVLRIIGFKPLESLPLWASLKPSVFIYPSEEEFVGSTRVFSALHQSLLSKNRYALSWYIARRNAAPVLAAVFASKEERGEEGEQMTPPGLWIKWIPFADNIRQEPETNLVKAPDTVIDAMRKVVEQLQLPKAVYDQQRYPNPSLQWFYKILQALALEEDLPEQAEDKTLPRWKQIHKRAGGYVFEWGRELDQNFEKWEAENASSMKPSSHGSTKRVAVAKLDGNKKPKAADSVEISDSEMRVAYETNSIAKFKVPELKAWLQGKGQGKGVTKKTDLVDAVKQYFESKMDIG